MNGVFASIETGGLGVVVSLHTSVDPSTEEWARYLDVVQGVLSNHRGDVSKLRNLIISDGGAPNAAQRRQAMDLVRGKPNKIGVLTNTLDNPIKRGVVTALTWLNPSFRAGPPAKWRELLVHLDLETHVDELLLEFDDLQRQFTPNATLTEVKKLIRAGE